MKGNLGKTKLFVLKQTDDAIYMAENTEIGVNYYTYFPSRHKMVYSKAYMIIFGDRPLIVFTSMGQCK